MNQYPHESKGDTAGDGPSDHSPQHDDSPTQAQGENQAAPTGTPGPKPSTRKDGKPTRKERKVANKEALRTVQLQEYEAARVAVIKEWPLHLERMQSRITPFSEDAADSLCAWVQAGKSMRSWLEQSGLHAETIYRWLRQSASFREQYTRAHEDRADTLADDLLQIADDCARNPSIEGVAAAKLRIETRRWIASKLKPGKWGERQEVVHTGGVSIRIGIPRKEAIQPVEVIEALDSGPKPTLTR